MISLLSVSALILCPNPSPPQIVGGQFQEIHQWQGELNGDYFGNAVADAGDVNGDGVADILVGASEAEVGGLGGSGKAYVYSGTDGSLIHDWSGPHGNARMGNAVSTAGDVNGDGFDDVIVGIYNAASAGNTKAGRVVVYSGVDGSTILRWDGTSADEYFGSAVAGGRDFDGDLIPDLVVGSANADPSGGSNRTGFVNVYSGATGALIYQIPGESNGDQFGREIAMLDDVDSDGVADLLIGAPLADLPAGGSNAGAAYVYSGASGTQLFRMDGEAVGDGFASSVSSAGDMNADGVPDLIVGSPWASAGGMNAAGAAYAHSGVDGSLLFQWNGEASGDVMGKAVSGATDIDQDGHADVLVGAYGTDTLGKSNRGSVYLYSGADGSKLWQWQGDKAAAQLGWALSLVGDLDDDGRKELIMSASSDGPANEGMVYVQGFNPFLYADIDELSYLTGGTVEFSVDFPDSTSGYDYRILVSPKGTGPSHFGIDIPLNGGQITENSYYGIYPVPTYSDMHGTLDADGNGTASITLPPTFHSNILGTYYFAAIASPVAGIPEFSSIAVRIYVLP